MATTKWTGSVSTAFGTSGNWTNGVPTTGDTAIFDQDAVGPVAGSDQSAITLAKLVILKSCTQAIGTNNTPLKIGATLVEIGQTPQNGGSFTGSTRINLDLHTAQTRVTIFDTGTGTPDTGEELVRIKGSNASNELYVLGGKSIGIATDVVGDAARFPTIGISGGTVNIGAGVTNTPSISVNGSAARVTIACAHTLTLTAGIVTTSGNYALATATLLGGTLYANHRNASGDEITTLNQRGGTINTKGDSSAFVIATHNLQSGKIEAFSSSQITQTALVIDWDDFTTLTVSATK